MVTHSINLDDAITLTEGQALVPSLVLIEIARDKTGGISRTYWAFSFYSDDLSGCVVLRPAPTSGYLCLEKLTLYSASALTFTLGEGKDIYYPDSVGKRILGPIEVSKEVEVGTPGTEEHFITGSTYEIDFTGPDGKESAKLSVAKALTIDASASGIVTGIVYGFTIGA